nr:MAG TPA: protein of unknown function DUF4603 [Caudoviricetes sp.]
MPNRQAKQFWHCCDSQTTNHNKGISLPGRLNPL